MSDIKKGPKLAYPQGATALSPKALSQLIPTYISTQSELNSLEKSNISDALIWAEGRSKLNNRTRKVDFAYELHKMMFRRVWKWAGKVRTEETNIGVPPIQIGSALSQLYHDLNQWITNQTYNWDEVGVRFHHRLVYIHIFTNGNGRHARLLTDLFMTANGQEKFTWGSLRSTEPIEVEGSIRNDYIAALQKSDRRNFSELLAFARN